MLRNGAAHLVEFRNADSWKFGHKSGQLSVFSEIAMQNPGGQIVVVYAEREYNIKDGWNNAA